MTSIRNNQSARSSQTSALEMMQQSSAFRQAVDRVATWKCLQAVKAGKLKMASENPSPNARYIPRMDLIDDPASPTLVAVFELPGIKTNDIALHIREGNLIVTGERRSPHIPTTEGAALPRYPVAAADDVMSGEMESGSASGVRLAVHELRFGSFHRAIRVPEGIKESEVSAGLQDGMLTVKWPRQPSGVLNAENSRPLATNSNLSPPTSFTTAAATAQ